MLAKDKTSSTETWHVVEHKNDAGGYLWTTCGLSLYLDDVVLSNGCLHEVCLRCEDNGTSE